MQNRKAALSSEQKLIIIVAAKVFLLFLFFVFVFFVIVFRQHGNVKIKIAAKHIYNYNLFVFTPEDVHFAPAN